MYVDNNNKIQRNTSKICGEGRNIGKYEDLWFKIMNSM